MKYYENLFGEICAVACVQTDVQTDRRDEASSSFDDSVS